MTEVQIHDPAQAIQNGNLILGSRPIYNKKTRKTYVTTGRGLKVNSALRKDEWESLDAAVIEAGRERLNIVEDLRSAGLTKNETLGVTVSQWNERSKMTAAEVNMSGRPPAQKDRLEFDLAGVPLPVISKGFTIGRRELEAARRLGTQLDTSHAEEAARVVSETLEDMTIDGKTLTFNGYTIYGLTNHPGINSDTASNYGGGDFATVSNGIKTVNGMITAAQGDNFYGPYALYVANTQYLQLVNTYYTDGSGDTDMDRIMRNPLVTSVSPSDWLAAGEVLMVQMERRVVDIAQVPGYELLMLEWVSDNEMEYHFQVVTVAVPRVKQDYYGNSGVVLATGA